MSEQKIYDFADPTDYQFDSDLIDFTALQKPRLKLQDDPGQDFIEDFADDTDFVYDSDLVEFVGGKVQQKVQKPNNSLLYAKWNTDEDADYAISDVTGILAGSASISGGKLSCVGEVIASLDFSNISQGDGNAGTAKFKWTPKYSGAPATEKHIFYNGGAISYNGAVWLIHSGTNLYFYIYNSVGAVVLSKTIAFSPIADTPYEIAITWDYTGANDSNLFINGDLKDGGNINDTRGDTLLIRLGSDLTSARKSDHEYDDFVIYDSVIYTANYTPGYTLPAYLYAASSVVLPEMGYTGVGTLIAVTAFIVISSGIPRIALEIGRSGDLLYWDSSQWIANDDTYAQANDPTTFSTNANTLPVIGEIYGQFKIYFTNSNSQSSLSNLIITLTAQIYPITNPSIIFNDSLSMEALENFIESAIKTGNDELKYILYKGAIKYYWNGASLEISDGTYPQSNTATEILANKASFTAIGITFAIEMFLHSADGTTTPTATSITVTYNFYGGDDILITKCNVWGYCVDENDDPISGVSITIELERDIVIYDPQKVIFQNAITTTSNSNGYWDVELIPTADLDNVNYRFTFSHEGNAIRYRRKVPAETSKNFSELTL